MTSKPDLSPRKEAGPNEPPWDVWHTLRRLLDCNRTQLATRLGVSPRTLRRWEGSFPLPPDAAARASDLLQWTLNRANSYDLAQSRLNRPNGRTDR